VDVIALFDVILVVTAVVISGSAVVVSVSVSVVVSASEKLVVSGSVEFCVVLPEDFSHAHIINAVKAPIVR
jgi:hypothetical protein